MTRDREWEQTVAPSLAVTRMPDSAQTRADMSDGLDLETGELAPSGYQLGDLLGRGGMGEVLLARDRRIGRDVAFKRMRTGSPTNGDLARFMREAKIQARLEHPAIVPVHDLGYDAEGRPYFTMKRLAGTTLHDAIVAKHPIQPLLRAFADVCLAVEFAHARGVVHRDLKPSNIMLGDFGEVYVLDWGVARVLSLGEANNISDQEIPAIGGGTQTGALLGTPGYMPPEQIRGEAIGPHADVYALGSILFEILAGTPLHPQGDALANTLAHPAASPAQRHPERQIVPELDAACVAALAEDPGERPSARKLADRVQRYLDGDRDTERRRALATEHLAHARKHLLAIPPSRADAMRAAARAVALDPENTDAAELVTALMLEPPAIPPPELLAQIAESERVVFRQQARISSKVVLSYFVALPLAISLGVIDWSMVIAAIALVFTIAALAWRAARTEKPRLTAAVVCNIVLMMVFSRWVSPLVIVPGLTCAVTVALLSFPPLLERWRVIIVAMLAGIGVPLILEASGAISSTWSMDHGSLVIHSAVVHFEGTPALVFIIGVNLMMIIVLGLFARVLAVSRRDAHRRAEAQAWHMRQLLPRESRR